MSETTIPGGKYVVWEHYGYEGWNFKSYDTLKEALSAQRFQSTFVVTKLIDYDVTEIADGELTIQPEETK